MMKVISLLSIAGAATASSGALRATEEEQRQLQSFSVIAGYPTGSQVTDHNAIDLDQEVIEEQLALKTTAGFQAAKDVYTKGGFSKSFARITLSSALSADLAKGTDITGVDSSGNAVSGKAIDNFVAGSTIVDVQYKTSEDQATYVNCQVGGLPAENVNTEGCLASSGEVTIGGTVYSYSYDPLSENMNARTIQGFSTRAESKMLTCPIGCPYPTFQKFYNYYGTATYADQWVLATLDGTATDFANGDADFSTGIGNEIDLRVDACKKGTAYMNVWMYVIREFEDALDDCQDGCTDCNDDPVHAWDEGVAFYTGSLHGSEEDTTSAGKLIYSLANKRCANFKTCGSSGDDLEGNSNVNMRLFDLFQQGQTELQEGRCDCARVTKNKVERLMAIPSIQGTLRYAYINGPQNDRSAKNLGEGAVFAAAVLPLVHDCSADDAAIIYNNLKVGAESIDFPAVKAAFERNYECMGVTCSDIGGYYDVSTGDYFPLAAPCENPPFDDIAGYSPGSQVTDHNAIDLDQATMETQLALKTTDGFAAARRVYTEGGNSKSFARITLATGLSSDLSKGAKIEGTASDGSLVEGKALSTFTAGTTTIDVQYVTYNDQDKYVNCRVGGLPSDTIDTAGCFAASGVVSIAGEGCVSYSYTPTLGNMNKRTIQGFSTEAASKMLTCAIGCPYPTFQKFYNYFGVADYADKFVLAAIDGTSTSFNNGATDFSTGTPNEMDFRVDFAKKATAYMNVWMYVIREFEDALDDCQLGCNDCNDDPVHAWDEGVAFYTGSIHGEDLDTTSSGNLYYALANKRCANYKTCGTNGNQIEGNAKINMELFDLFEKGKTELQMGQCDGARITKNRIEELMPIPAIQGTLRYSYITGPQDTRTPKAIGEGAVFALSVLPLVHDCSPDDAAIIFENMRGDATSQDFSAVKAAFERNYACMGISCSDVGGYYDAANDEYYPLASPCNDADLPSGTSSAVTVVLSSIWVAVAASALMF